MRKKKILISKNQIEMLAEEQIKKIKKEELDDFIGSEEDRRIDYSMTDFKNKTSAESGVVNLDDMKSAPSELLEYLNKIEEAKSILSKVAAREDNKTIKDRIYSHYEKAQKLAFELIKEFGIVH
jgi:hypothetical protein